jgi:hypothetical protein
MPINKDKAQAALDDAGRNLITQLQAMMVSTGANATGKTSASLAYGVTFTPTSINFQLTGGTGWAFVEQGRGPTKKGGDGAVYRAIKEWAAARGIDQAAVYPITRFIHGYTTKDGKKVGGGTRLWRAGERRDIYTSLITKEGVQRIADSVGVLGETSLGSDIVNALK